MRFFVLALLLSLTCSVQATPRILIDSVHAHNFLAAPAPDEFSYHSTYGMRRGFAWLQSQGAEIEELKSGRLTAEKLKTADVVFLNLVSADLPPFFPVEIADLKNWITNGGSLFVITDHSNCYYHASKLAPLFEALDLETHFVTACDVAPHTLGTGNGWIAVSDFKPHPITQNLRAIGIQSGGTTDARFGLAWTSPQSWGDFWQIKPYGETTDLGFYGNWKKDETEKNGPLAVVSAKDFGKGRIVVAGDQNLFGDPFFDYLDNGKLWRNAWSWLVTEAKLNDQTAYEKWRGPTILAWEPKSANWGNDSSRGFFHLFGQLNRVLPMRADSQIGGSDALVVLADDQILPDGLAAHLKAGKNAIVLESDGKGALFAELEKQLGQPEIGAANGAKVWSWAEDGQILALPNGLSWRNSAIPAPEKRPNEEQQLRLKNLGEILREAMAK